MQPEKTQENPAEEALPEIEIKPGEEPLPAPPKASELSPESRRRVLLAILFASPEALAPTRLAEAAGFTLGETRATMEELKAWLAQAQLPFRVEEIGGGFRLLSLPEFDPYVRRLQGVRRQDRLSQAALETLAIVAYRQPIIKAEIEAIRGVQVGPILRTLIDKKLVKVAGRAEVPGRPLQYGTSQSFLDRFGLKSLEELPTLEELKQS